MKPEHFQKIEKELHDQIASKKQQQVIQPKLDLWNVCFDNGPADPRPHGGFDGESEETFYSLSDDDLAPLTELSVHLPYNGQGLVEKVSQAGIVPLHVPVEARNGKFVDKSCEYTM